MTNNNKNSLNMNNDTDTISLNELKDYFECPVCLCVPRKPPIWQCDKVIFTSEKGDSQVNQLIPWPPVSRENGNSKS